MLAGVGVVNFKVEAKSFLGVIPFLSGRPRQGSFKCIISIYNKHLEEEEEEEKSLADTLINIDGHGLFSIVGDGTVGGLRWCWCWSWW